MFYPYSWSVLLDTYGQRAELPHVVNFGGHEVNTPLYYHDASVRTDRPHIVFQYTLSGEGRFRCRGEEYRILPGSGFLCNTHDPEIAYYYPPDGMEPYELFYCCILGNCGVIEDLAQKFGPVFQLDRDNPAISQFLHYRMKKGERKIIRATLSQSMAMASQLLNGLVASAEEATPKPLKASLSQKVEIYLMDNIEQKVNVSELAHLFDVSLGHLSRQFKCEQGISLKKFMMERRMRHALKLLNSSKMSVKEVSYRMNYGSPTHFCRDFKLVNGVTPGKARG